MIDVNFVEIVIEVGVHRKPPITIRVPALATSLCIWMVRYARQSFSDQPEKTTYVKLELGVSLISRLIPSSTLTDNDTRVFRGKIFFLFLRFRFLITPISEPKKKTSRNERNCSKANVFRSRLRTSLSFSQMCTFCVWMFGILILGQRILFVSTS
jgi:hypothetical protein